MRKLLKGAACLLVGLLVSSGGARADWICPCEPPDCVTPDWDGGWTGDGEQPPDPDCGEWDDGSPLPCDGDIDLCFLTLDKDLLDCPEEDPANPDEISEDECPWSELMFFSLGAGPGGAQEDEEPEHHPEPASVVLMGLGGFALVGYQYRRQKSR